MKTEIIRFDVSVVTTKLCILLVDLIRLHQIVSRLFEGFDVDCLCWFEILYYSVVKGLSANREKKFDDLTLNSVISLAKRFVTNGYYILHADSLYTFHLRCPNV